MQGDKVQDKDMFTELVRSVRRSRITKNCSFVTKIDRRPYMYYAVPEHGDLSRYCVGVFYLILNIQTGGL